MDILLIDVDKLNLSDYIVLEEKNDLSYFMSRTRPYNYNEKNQLSLFWKYICIENIKIGALWIEKENEDSTNATLGIFISDEINFCKGIGAKAIELAIIQVKKIMNIMKIELHVRDSNIRAIRCYEKCGFNKSDKFIKKYLNEDINVIVMSRIL